MNNHVLLTANGCVNLDSQLMEVCLPVKESCRRTPTDGLLSECGNAWNCATCPSDNRFGVPFVRGDKIQLQTLFYDSYNGNPKQPTNGWGSFVKAEFTGNISGTITNLAAFASRKMVAYGCGRSYQIIEIDTALFPDTCWNVELTAYDQSNNPTDQVCSQEFEVFDNCGGQVDSVLIRGNYTAKDCFGHCYGEPDAYLGDLIEYDNTRRFRGYIKASGGSFTKTVTSAGKVTKVTLQEEFTLQLGQRIPPFYSNILLKELLPGDTVTVDGEDYTIETFSISNQVERGRMMLYSVTLFRQCENVKGC